MVFVDSLTHNNDVNLSSKTVIKDNSNYEESTNEVWITTKDNPYDPFKQYDLWFNFDLQKGYNLPGLVARFANVSDDMPVPMYNDIVERAIDRIIEIDPLNLYKKVYKD